MIYRVLRTDLPPLHVPCVCRCVCHVAGQVKEYDSPRNLMMNPQSEFYAMVQETGEQNAAYLKAVALGISDAESVMSKDDMLASRAKQKLVESSLSSQMECGPLMRAIYRAATQLQVCFVLARNIECYSHVL
jgi:ABC-type proline/glycine betaine transport system ATPase subunit